MINIPQDESDLVSSASLNGELVIVDGITAVVGGHLGNEVGVGGIRSANLVNNNLSGTLVHLEDDITVGMAELKLLELLNAIVADGNTRHVIECLWGKEKVLLY